MKLIRDISFDTGGEKFTLEFSSPDLLWANFTEFDLRLLRECEKSDRFSDKILGLQTICEAVERGDKR